MRKQKFCCLERPTSIKRKLYLWNIYRLVRGLLRQKLDSCYHFNLESGFNDQKNLAIITIAFNNTKVLQHQIDLVNENIKDTNFIHVIADNSPFPERQQAIQELCRKNNLGYILLPKSNYLDKRSGSYSHGAAATWLYYNYISLVRPINFGFLDHDLYPVSPIAIDVKLKEQPLYGFMEYRKSIGYIWMGLIFMNFQWTLDKIINFLPCKLGDLYLDTGGSNWYSLYSQIPTGEMIFPGRTRKEVYLNGKKYADPVDYIDGCWFHTNNGSNWRREDTHDWVVEQLIKHFSLETSAERIEIDHVNPHNYS